MKTETRDRRTCPGCDKRFNVVYRQTDPDEQTRKVDLACPHCGAVNHVPVGSAAAGGGEYWAEKIVP